MIFRELREHHQHIRKDRADILNESIKTFRDALSGTGIEVYPNTFFPPLELWEEERKEQRYEGRKSERNKSQK